MTPEQFSETMKLPWEYIRAMIRFVWIIYPPVRGASAVRVHDRYTNRNAHYLIGWN